MRLTEVRFVPEEDGPTAVEYAVMLALIIVVHRRTTRGSNASATFTERVAAKATPAGGS